MADKQVNIPDVIQGPKAKYCIFDHYPTHDELRGVAKKHFNCKSSQLGQPKQSNTSSAFMVFEPREQRVVTVTLTDDDE